jgi:uncharacterized RDD family membrane protein YckC
MSDTLAEDRRIATNTSPAPSPRLDVASFRSRAGGYVVDMVIFAAVAMVILVAAGTILLASTDWAQQDASDSQLYTFLSIIGFGAPLTWTLLNISLLATRGQTGGHYVAGIRIVREDGASLSPAQAAGWWFCLNPLLFSWPMAIVAGGPIAAVIALLVDSWSVIAFVIVVTLCLVMPIASLIAAWLDRQNRTLHDRIIGAVAVHAS